MKIKKMILSNFRGYKGPTEIDFNDLTVFVGKNDIGKSTILEALDLFFNEGKDIIKFDKNDINIGSDLSEYTIDVVFKDVPKSVVIDSTFKTDLNTEFLLNKEGDFEIIKKYTGSSKFSNIFIHAYHPTNPECANLQLKKAPELKKIIKDKGIDCPNQSINSIMRQSIWRHYNDNLQLANVDIDISKGDDTKRIWDRLSLALPVFSLFQADRENSDSDKVVQDPLKAAVNQFLQDEELQSELNRVAEQVLEKLTDVSKRTLKKLKEMDPEVAESLKPVIPNVKSLKWAEVFKNVSITADEGIPINKRGSGVKRLILLNFFRAEAERRHEKGENTGIIYAIEEPETSQHFINQRILADALISLSKTNNTQVILTTHSGIIVKKLKFEDLRLVAENEKGAKVVTNIQTSCLVYPSLNEVNYTAFGEVTEEYHDELWGFIESNGLMDEFENGKKQIPYVRQYGGGKIKEQSRTLSHYIRDVMHHPENTYNRHYTYEELIQSVEEMRSFISYKNGTV